MDPVWKKKWVEALRSGDFKQGRFALKYEYNKYCCLGVLCDLVIKEDGNYFWQEGPDCRMYIKCLDDYEESKSTLLSTIQLFTGINGYGGFADHTGITSLIHLNDDKLYNFNQIADVIEEYF